MLAGRGSHRPDRKANFIAELERAQTFRKFHSRIGTCANIRICNASEARTRLTCQKAMHARLLIVSIKSASRHAFLRCHCGLLLRCFQLAGNGLVSPLESTLMQQNTRKFLAQPYQSLKNDEYSSVRNRCAWPTQKAHGKDLLDLALLALGLLGAEMHLLERACRRCNGHVRLLP